MFRGKTINDLFSMVERAEDNARLEPSREVPGSVVEMLPGFMQEVSMQEQRLLGVA